MIVVDEQGNEYEATYPKRAKGLVKNGRARFVGENKICLACPPDDNCMEDKKMTDTETKVAKTAKKLIDNSEGSTKYTLDYALEQLDKVRNESSTFAVETRQKISEIKANGPGAVGVAAAGDALRIDALRTLAQEQEQIFRRLIDFYIEMISDLKKDASQKNSERL